MFPLQHSAGLGELYLSLMWNPTTEKCHVTITKARNLAKLDLDSEYGRPKHTGSGSQYENDHESKAA